MSKGDNGYIKLYRNIMDWEWYSNHNATKLFIHCLLKANYTEKEWQGKKLPIGSFVTSYEKLSKELNLSIRAIRTALKNLKKTHELTHNTTNQYSVIKVNNYTKYQQTDNQNGSQMTSKRQANDKQVTTTNKVNKGIKKEYYDVDRIFKKLEDSIR